MRGAGPKGGIARIAKIEMSRYAKKSDVTKLETTAAGQGARNVGPPRSPGIYPMQVAEKVRIPLCGCIRVYRPTLMSQCSRRETKDGEVGEC